MNSPRTIKDVLNLVTGEMISADTLFDDEKNREAEIFQLRFKIQSAIQTNKPECVCLFCKQPIVLRGRKDSNDRSSHFYFAHNHDSDDCLIKTKHKLSKEQILRIQYNGAKESQMHNLLKNKIGYYLEKTNEVKDVKIEAIYREKAISKDWRKPDVLACYQNMKIAFELQLSTTFISVIVERTIFYQERGVFLIWVFQGFSMTTDLQKFTQKDVYYNNNFNVYVFDNDAQDKSEETKELILKCYYKDFYERNGVMHEKWEHIFIKLSDLKFNPTNYSVHFIDSEERRFEVQKKVNLILQEEKEQDLIRQKVRKAINFLKHLTTNLNDFSDNPFNHIKTTEEIDYLNQKLKFTTMHSWHLTNWFIERKHHIFLKFIFCEDKILVNTALMKIKGRTVLQDLIDVDDTKIFNLYISLLFRKGYIVTKDDYLYIQELYSKNYLNDTYIERDKLNRWAYCHFFANLKTKQFAMDIHKVEVLLYAIYSLKNNVILYWKFSNLIQITHNMLEHHSIFCNLYLYALDYYDILEEQLRSDETGKLKQKIKDFLMYEVPQENQYNNIVCEVFPELGQYQNIDWNGFDDL